MSKYIVKYNGQVLTRPLSYQEAHDMAILLNADNRDREYEVSLAGEQKK